MLLTRLEEYGESLEYMSVLARVAAELPANSFWQRMGYTVLRQLSGGGTKPRTINLRGKQLRVRSLFSDATLPQRPSTIAFVERPLVSELIYVLDLNVVYDIIKNRAGQDIAQQVVTLALAGPYRLYVTSEASHELSRTSPDPSSDSVLRFVHNLPALPDVPAADVAVTVDQLASIIHRAHRTDLPPNEQSDLVHLAHSIHHHVRGFVTSDRKLRQANPERIALDSPT